jgi:hypothetical protein
MNAQKCVSLHWRYKDKHVAIISASMQYVKVVKQ